MRGAFPTSLMRHWDTLFGGGDVYTSLKGAMTMAESDAIETRVGTLEREMREIKQEIRSHADQIQEIRLLNTEFKKDLERITEKLDEIAFNLKELMEVPKNRWNSAVGTVITAVLAAIIGFMLRGVGL